VPIMSCLRDRKETLVRERFFLGGVSSLRGFRNKGVGPHVDVPRAQPAESVGPDVDVRKARPSERGVVAVGGDIFASLRTAVRSPHLQLLLVRSARIGLNCLCLILL
jgi:outer membrane protein assembly factor BamA